MITWKSLNLNFKVLNFSFILKKGRECNVCIRALMRVCMDKGNNSAGLYNNYLWHNLYHMLHAL